MTDDETTRYSAVPRFAIKKYARPMRMAVLKATTLPRRLMSVLLSQSQKGCVEYFLDRKLKSGFGGPFNGQAFRQEIFRQIIRKCSFDAILETGTYRGTTTEYLASASGLPTYTVELNPRFASYASMRFRRNKNVHVIRSDSRTAIEALASTIAAPFCYLDAHWNEDVPLNGELALIAKQWPNAVVMIDDFRVDDDPDYTYDDYGDGKQLTIEYLDADVKHGMSGFFPNQPGARESGARRGCIVLSSTESIQTQLLSQLASLRHIDDFAAPINTRVSSS